MARQMPSNHIIGNRKETPVGTIRTFDPRFLADTANPFVGASRRITGLASFPALEAKGINVRPSAKQRPKQADLYGGRRIVCYHAATFGICQTDYTLVPLIPLPLLPKRPVLEGQKGATKVI
jgi:hypothetical protein